jgi:hypothetical protein
MRFLLRIIKNEKNHSRLLIAGDPVLGFLITFMAKLFSFMNTTISSWSDVKFAFGIYLQIIFTLYKVLIENTLA